MMNRHTNLVTTYNFRGKEYLVNVCQGKNQSGTIELKVKDKKTSEEWLGSYDASYIENLTQKTGNFKRFETFISMLKSGLLNTSLCVSLDLLTFEDLEMLRNRVSHSQSFSASHNVAPSLSNRRYLIVTYTVEFDRIHYPLAMEYCGLPDPRILQETIQRLEKQVTDLQHQLNYKPNNWEEITEQIDLLQKKVVNITTENIFLKEQIKKTNQSSMNQHFHKKIEMLLQTIDNLENKLKTKCDTVEKLKKENSQLLFKLEEALRTESFLKAQLNSFQFEPRSIIKSERKSLRPTKRYQSPSPNRNRSLDNLTDKPFQRHDSRDRKIHSARSSFDTAFRSSSEDSVILEGVRGRLKQRLNIKLSPRTRAPSPTLSELSHHSELSRCACKYCLQSKFLEKEVDQSIHIKKQRRGRGKATLLKRIQSLEKLVSGIALH